MIIAGLIKSSLIDYPGKVAAVIFTQGCNFRCGFCHNASLIGPEALNSKSQIPTEEALDFLKKRVGKLDGVVITGGEPTLQPDLVEFIKKVKRMSFAIKLDTNGSSPTVIRSLFVDHLIDYIAMDIKNSPERYEETCGYPFSNQIKESIGLIMGATIDYEFRTTVLPAFHNEKSIEGLAKIIRGAKKYTIQNFRNGNVYDPKLKDARSFSRRELERLKKIAEQYITDVQVRENL